MPPYLITTMPPIRRSSWLRMRRGPVSPRAVVLTTHDPLPFRQPALSFYFQASLSTKNYQAEKGKNNRSGTNLFYTNSFGLSGKIPPRRNSNYTSRCLYSIPNLQPPSPIHPGVQGAFLNGPPGQSFAGRTIFSAEGRTSIEKKSIRRLSIPTNQPTHRNSASIGHAGLIMTKRKFLNARKKKNINGFMKRFLEKTKY